MTNTHLVKDIIGYGGSGNTSHGSLLFQIMILWKSYPQTLKQPKSKANLVSWVLNTTVHIGAILTGKSTNDNKETARNMRCWRSSP